MTLAAAARPAASRCTTTPKRRLSGLPPPDPPARPSTGLGHDQPTMLITNQPQLPARQV